MSKNQNKTDSVNAEFENVNAQGVEIVTTNLKTVSGEKRILFPEEQKKDLIQMFISAEVSHYEFDKETCEALVKSSSKLKVRDENDKLNYDKVKEAYNKLVKVRTSSDAARKEIGKPYSDIKAGIDDYQKTNIIGVTSAEETRLKAEKEKFEKWEQAKKEREAAEAKKKLYTRVTELKEAGLVFDSELYVLGETISMDLGSIGKLSDSDYLAFVEKVKAEKKKIDEAEAERIRLEEEEKQAIQDQKDENERKAKELRDEILEVRRDKLLDAGFSDDSEKERFYIMLGVLIEISYDDAAAKSRNDFNEYLSEIQKTKIEQAEQATVSTEPVYEAEEVQEETEHVSYYYSISNVDDITPDVPSLKAYIKSICNMPMPKLKTVQGNDILAAFKNNLKLSCDEVLNLIDPNHQNQE